ncbi:ABC transporter ATP-binding protein OS=Lysinibacillus sphaericus OX=1421 GN=LS41612_09845 PE=3 SV=1 [Lysinibacillus sphaericus]
MMIPAGQTVGIVGESGSGKTMLCHAVIATISGF